MGIISGKQLSAALEKAKAVGLVEEAFLIGDCEVVLRNLRPQEYEAVVADVKDLEDLEYLDRWQSGHLARAIVQVNGVDLRDTEFVEVEEADPKNKGQVRTVKRELHDWLLKNILSTWSKEAIFTAYRKFTDVVFLAENKAKEGIQFVVAEETNEEKFRRLLSEVKELEGEVPPALARTILEESGYTQKLALNNYEDGTTEQPSGEATQSPTSSPSEEKTAADLASMMRQRVPLNQRPVLVPEAPKASASPPPPDPIPAPVVAPQQEPPTGVSAQGRSAEIAAAIAMESGALEGDLRAPIPQAVLPPGMAAPPGVAFAQPPAEKPVLARPGTVHTDPRAMAAILNQPPRGVMNPKFRPPGR